MSCFADDLIWNSIPGTSSPSAFRKMTSITCWDMDDYESYNPHVLTAVKTYKNQTAAAIDNARWEQARTAKPKHLDQMTAAEKDAFKQTSHH